VEVVILMFFCYSSIIIIFFYSNPSLDLSKSLANLSACLVSRLSSRLDNPVVNEFAPGNITA
jgi:hypothetical protein